MKLKFKTGIIVGVLSGMGISHIAHKKMETTQQQENKVDKFKKYYQLLNHWLILKQCNVNLSDFFSNHSYQRVAIYGMGELGERLYSEIKNNVEVIYGIDQNKQGKRSELQIVLDEECLDPVDVIVVTAIFDFDKIEKKLRKKCDYDIISLKDIVTELEYEKLH